VGRAGGGGPADVAAAVVVRVAAGDRGQVGEARRAAGGGGEDGDAAVVGVVAGQVGVQEAVVGRRHLPPGRLVADVAGARRVRLTRLHRRVQPVDGQAL